MRVPSKAVLWPSEAQGSAETPSLQASARHLVLKTGLAIDLLGLPGLGLPLLLQSAHGCKVFGLRLRRHRRNARELHGQVLACRCCGRTARHVPRLQHGSRAGLLRLQRGTLEVAEEAHCTGGLQLRRNSAAGGRLGDGCFCCCHRWCRWHGYSSGHGVRGDHTGRLEPRRRNVLRSCTCAAGKQRGNLLSSAGCFPKAGG
mmetsp:Transcript_19088/g.43355  ORF Transcript_19088/g.43355 Transcript_19088/m.43355 type:complete len:201 (+) Transcript_19088:34-636(+)